MSFDFFFCLAGFTQYLFSEDQFDIVGHNTISLTKIKIMFSKENKVLPCPVLLFLFSFLFCHKISSLSKTPVTVKMFKISSLSISYHWILSRNRCSGISLSVVLFCSLLFSPSDHQCYKKSILFRSDQTPQLNLCFGCHLWPKGARFLDFFAHLKTLFWEYRKKVTEVGLAR